MKNGLAIVIPAYKEAFFEETLKSIANQTCKKFTLYIGDDASPHNLYGITKAFEDKIKIIYKRFAENLGGKDLVAHWGRCIDQVQNENWIWLFSDDDIIEPDCVERFYISVNKFVNVDLLHFNIKIIDQNGEIIKRCKPFPEHMKVTDFFSRRIRFKVNSSVVEYIFKKDIYYLEDGFKNYDLAWCADDATWIKFGRHKGIMTIPGPKVSWRYSGINISSNIADKKIIQRKLCSSLRHIKWVTEYFGTHNLNDNTTKFDKVKWIISIIAVTSAFSLKEKYSLTLIIIQELGYSNIKALAGMYLLYCETKHFLAATILITKSKQPV